MEKEFIVASSIKQAALLKNCSYQFLAGGTEINRLNSSIEESSLISLSKLALSEISQDDEFVKIGSTCTFQKIMESKIAPSYLRKACSFMASRTKRNMATIGGNIALLRDDSYLIPTLSVANAKLEMLNNKGTYQTIEIKEFINNKDDYKDCLIVNVLLPRVDMYIRSKRCSQTAQSHAYITVSLCKEGKTYRIFAGLKNCGFVELSTLTTILSKKSRVSCDDIVQLVSETNEISFYDDIYGSNEYKRYILGVSIYELYSELRGGASK